jgi:hypothetical protein
MAAKACHMGPTWQDKLHVGPMGCSHSRLAFPQPCGRGGGCMWQTQVAVQVPAARCRCCSCAKQRRSGGQGPRRRPGLNAPSPHRHPTLSTPAARPPPVLEYPTVSPHAPAAPLPSAMLCPPSYLQRAVPRPHSVCHALLFDEALDQCVCWVSGGACSLGTLHRVLQAPCRNQPAAARGSSSSSSPHSVCLSDWHTRHGDVKGHGQGQHQGAVPKTSVQPCRYMLHVLRACTAWAMVCCYVESTLLVKPCVWLLAIAL